VLTALLVLAFGVVPVGLYFWKEHKTSTPKLQWPVLGKILNLQFSDLPPRLSCSWNGRELGFEALAAGGVRATAKLNAATRLRVECGEKALVTKRAGMVVPDPVEPILPEFRDRLLARCSDKAAGPVVFDEAMQHRLAGMPEVDFVGQGAAVSWTFSALKDPDTAEAVMGALCAVADALEGYPQGGKGIA
jgi:hypothetical protein